MLISLTFLRNLGRRSLNACLFVTDRIFERQRVCLVALVLFLMAQYCVRFYPWKYMGCLRSFTDVKDLRNESFCDYERQRIDDLEGYHPQ